MKKETKRNERNGDAKSRKKKVGMDVWKKKGLDGDDDDDDVMGK